MAANQSFALCNLPNRLRSKSTFACLEKDNPIASWILSPDSLPPHAPGGLRVLYATTSLDTTAILDCEIVMPAAIWRTPGRGEPLRCYHLVGPEFYWWARGGLLRLERQIEAEREKLLAAAPSRDPDAIAPDPAAGVLSLENQLHEGRQRWQVVQTWTERFMDAAAVAAAMSSAVTPGWEPPRYRDKPNQEDLDGLAWVAVWEWTRGV